MSITVTVLKRLFILLIESSLFQFINIKRDFFLAQEVSNIKMRKRANFIV